MNSAVKEDIEIVQKACDERRKQLPKGPWTYEPDRVEFQHAGLDCLLQRNHSLFNWCGYVGVPKDHPSVKKLYKKELKIGDKSLGEIWECDDDDLDVHGGITYREECRGPICHLTDKEEDSLFWFGFDCAHFGDLVPGIEAMRHQIPTLERLGSDDDSYRNVHYVTEETKRLAEQLAGMTK